MMAVREPEPVAGLVALDRTSLRERAMSVLRGAVTSGEIAPGTKLVETELSAAMGISRGTLREALRQLEYEGLLEVGERGRLTVRTLTDAEIMDVFAVRAALEGLAASIVSARPDRAALVARLQAALDALEAAGGSITDTVEVDLAFHRLLCELTGNPTLVNMSADRHRDLVDAIATGDPDAAATAVEEHMGGAARTLLGTE
jgi:DNA-binding GntR family transcriptional regulator